MSADQFRKAEEQYFSLKGQLEAGRITQDQFEVAVKELMVQDTQGRYWMLGPDSGKWYVHDGKTWVEAQSPGPGAPAVTPLAPAQTQPRPPSNVVIIAAGIVVVLCMLGAISLLLLANLGFGKTAQVSPTVLPILAPASVIPMPKVTGAPTPVGGGTGRIAFVTNRDVAIGNSAIYVMNADGSQRINLTSSPGNLSKPAWSPDGAHIAFVSDRDGRSEIYVMNANGGYPTRLTNHPAGSVYPAWSPDGTRIAFQSSRDGNWQLYVTNADASQVIRLTNNPGHDGHPDWSPDGKRIAFVSSRDGNWEIYVMNADGSQPVRMTNTSKNQYYPKWSPDGTRIAFATDRDGNWEIYVMNADGSQQTRLTRTAAQDFFPAWSADGTQIYFASERDGNFQIYTMKPDGSQQVRISSNAAVETWPDWQPRETSAEAFMTPPSSVNALATLWLPSPTIPRPTATVTPTLSAGATLPSATTMPPPTATIPPGLYVSALRLEPGPRRGVDIAFYPMFLNTTGGTQTYRVKVYLYRVENMRNSFGETSVAPITIPVGSTEQKALGSWKLGGGGGCEDFLVRVGWIDENNRITFFNKPDGNMFEHYAAICP